MKIPKNLFSTVILSIFVLTVSAQQDGIGIGTTSPHPSAALELNDSARGFLAPRMTMVQRNQIIDPAVGLQIYNTTTDCLEIFGKGKWNTIYCIPSDSIAGLSNGLVAYYPFNGNANDESGNGNHGVVNGATLTTDRFGNSNKAYSFNGVNNYIQLNSLFQGLAGSTAATFVCWAKKNINGSGCLISQWVTNSTPSGPIGLFYGLTQNDISTAAMIGGVDIISSQTALNTNQWNLYAIVYDNNQPISSDKVKIFQNGNLLALQSFTAPPQFGDQSNICTIGARGVQYSLGSISGFFSGIIDEVTIYNRALTQAEITYLATH